MLHEAFSYCFLTICVLITSVISAGASQIVYGDSGKSNIRVSPSKDSSPIGVLHQGESLEYMGDTEYDNRGVAWYSVRYDGQKAYVSSKYTLLKSNGSSSSDSYEDEYDDFE